jgi:integrase
MRCSGTFVAAVSPVRSGSSIRAKAALNYAWKSGHVPNDEAWRRVRPFREVDIARVRYLTEAECTRLANVCEPDFRNLVVGALLTGCRYSELATMQIADFNADVGVLTVRISRGSFCAIA